jgi:general secretion pathway protein K
MVSLRKSAHRLRSSERGVALLAVLLGIALMTLVVVDFAMTAGLGFVSAANQANELRAYYLGRSGINLGLALLAEDARMDAKADSPFDSLYDSWAMPFPTMPLEGGNVAVTVVDETRKLNINAMVDQNGTPNQPAIQRMERLFTILNVDVALLPGIVEWITPSVSTGGGVGADYYLGLRPPYQPRFGPMPTIADLQLVKGINEAVFNRIRPFLTVMPETQVNVNTASGQVLAALEPELMEDQKTVEQILEARQSRPFTKVTDVVNDIPAVAAFGTRLTQVLTTRSQYFTINGMGTYADARKVIAATFLREQTGIGTLMNWHED